MTPIGIVAIIIASILFTSVFVFGLRTKGPWGSGWTFFTIIALTLSAVSLWVPPAGPIWYGAAWIDLLITGLLISFILSAVTPSHSEYEYRRRMFESDVLSGDGSIREHDGAAPYHNHDHQQKTLINAGSFFWMLLLLLCVLIIVGAT
jgi:hypothetical protein